MPHIPKPQDNQLLAALSPEVQDRLFGQLELVPLKLRSVICEAQSPISHVYFPIDAIVSLQSLLEDGGSTALSVVGNEGLLGINLFLGEETSTSRSLVQSAGFAYRLAKPRVLEEFNRHGDFMQLSLRYTQALITQISQTAVCNRHHLVAQQVCRWLLVTIDHLPHPSLTMTHEFLGSMLGVRREGVTEAALDLQRMGVISYSRGHIEVMDRTQLEALACECYHVGKTETDALQDYLQQRQAIHESGVIPAVRLGSHWMGAKAPAPRLSP